MSELQGDCSQSTGRGVLCSANIVVCQLPAFCRKPNAGACWEACNDEKMQALGFAPVSPWPVCYIHPAGCILTLVYVDGFDLAERCPSHMDTSEAASIHDSTPFGRHLGLSRR